MKSLPSKNFLSNALFVLHLLFVDFPSMELILFLQLVDIGLLLLNHRLLLLKQGQNTLIVAAGFGLVFRVLLELVVQRFDDSLLFTHLR